MSGRVIEAGAVFSPVPKSDSLHVRSTLLIQPHLRWYLLCNSHLFHLLHREQHCHEKHCQSSFSSQQSDIQNPHVLPLQVACCGTNSLYPTPIIFFLGCCSMMSRDACAPYLPHKTHLPGPVQCSSFPSVRTRHTPRLSCAPDMNISSLSSLGRLTYQTTGLAELTKRAPLYAPGF